MRPQPSYFTIPESQQKQVAGCIARGSAHACEEEAGKAAQSGLSACVHVCLIIYLNDNNMLGARRTTVVWL